MPALDRDLEAGDDPGIAAAREELGIRIPGRNPGVAVLGVRNDVGEAPGAEREEPDGLLAGWLNACRPARPSGQKTTSPGARVSSPFCLRSNGRPMRTKNISSAPKCMCKRSSSAPGPSSYTVAPIRASSGRQKTRRRVAVSSSSPSQSPENRFCRVIRWFLQGW